MPSGATAEERATKGLWFGVCASVVAWAVHGLSGYFVAWQACQDGDGDWGPLSAGEVKVLLFAWTAIVFAVAVAGWLTSVRNWRRLSGGRSPLHDDGVESLHFLALAGTLTSTAFLVAIVWASAPLFLVGVCVTKR